MLFKSLVGSLLLLVASFSCSYAKEVKLLHDIGPYSYYGWLYHAKINQYFEDRGIELNILGAGGGGNKTAMLVASGKADIGIVDFTAVVQTNSKIKTPKIKAFYVLDDRGQMGLFSLKDLGNPFNDKTPVVLASNPNSTTAKVLSLFSTKKFEYINIKHSLKEIMVLEGHANGVLGFETTILFNFNKLGVPNNLIYKYPLVTKESIGRVLIVNNDFAKDNPEILSTLVDITKNSILDVYRNPQLAISSVLESSNTLDADIEYERLYYWLDELVFTNRVLKRGLNYERAVDLDTYKNDIVNITNLKHNHPISEYYVYIPTN